MSSQAAAAPPSTSEKEPLRRRPDEGLVGGVCAGLARRLQVDVKALRVFGALIAGAGGVGLALYALAWAVIPVAPESRGRPRRPGAWREAVLTVLAVVVVLWVLRRLGLVFDSSVLWPAVVGIAGLALVWRPLGDAPPPAADRPPPSGRFAALRARLRLGSPIDVPRVVLGVLMVSFASAALLHHYAVMHSLGKAIGAVALVMAVVASLGLPWFLRLWRSLAFERSARIREQERAEVAAHLHDSVLQTLALIQKRAGDPREVAGLARRQERELRTWLNGPAHPAAAAGDPDTVATALQRAAAEIEELHGVPIEVVTVGDVPLDSSLEAVVSAAREAMTNAAKFAKADRVDLYAEVLPGCVEVFVRDRGVGFDTTSVPEDRRGVRDSIVGRMERHRGLATVRSRPGEGTEVELQMGRKVPA